MKLVVEGTQAYRRHRGWGRYNELLLLGLHRHASEHMASSVFYHEDKSHTPLAEIFVPSSRFLVHPVETTLKCYTEIEENFHSSYIDQNFPDCDLYHSVTEFPFYSKKVPLVCTIHELTPLLFKKQFSQQFTAEFFHYVSYATQNAVHLICPSSRTKTDLLENFKLDSNRITVIPNGLKPGFKTNDRIGNFRDYFIYVGGTDKPSKNFSCFLQAFQQFLLRSTDACELIVVNSEHTEQSFKRRFSMDDLAIKHITIKSDISDKELINLYQNATALVYPSWYEGFALPVIEALACGCPVLCDESLPAVQEWPVCQVIGTGVNDVEVLAESLQDMIRHRQDNKRQAMANATNVQNMFCLERFIDAHIAVYGSV